MQAVPLKPGIDPYTVLEAGDVLLLPDATFRLSEADCNWMGGIQQIGRHHKNISYKPQRDTLSGVPKAAGDMRSRLHVILRHYSEAAVARAASLLPRYRSGWRVDYASFRPMEEAGRELPLKKRNDLLHTDAFPTRPTGGGMILRIFCNLHSSKPRVWLISEPFEKLASRYAMAAGLGRIADRRTWFRNLAKGLRLPVPSRSAYDEFMLKFHDFLKRNAEFQAGCPKSRLEFLPGTAWMVFTDVVPHAVSSGQFAMEQTIIVRPESLAAPERAPISILQNLAGRSLA